MSITNLSARLEVTDEPVSSEVTVHFANEVLVGGELLALDDFVAGVLHGADETVEPLRSPGEHRTILRFADRLAATHLPFDRLRFIHAATAARLSLIGACRARLPAGGGTRRGTARPGRRLRASRTG